jgi:hypothetical protein
MITGLLVSVAATSYALVNIYQAQCYAAHADGKPWFGPKHFEGSLEDACNEADEHKRQFPKHQPRVEDIGEFGQAPKCPAHRGPFSATASCADQCKGTTDPTGTQLTKCDIVCGMTAIMSRVLACYSEYKVPGMAMVHVAISKGHTLAATVTGSFAGTPTGACVEKAVKAATFAKAKNDSTIDYPFMLR